MKRTLAIALSLALAGGVAHAFTSGQTAADIQTEIAQRQANGEQLGTIVAAAVKVASGLTGNAATSLIGTVTDGLITAGFNTSSVVTSMLNAGADPTTVISSAMVASGDEGAVRAGVAAATNPPADSLVTAAINSGTQTAGLTGSPGGATGSTGFGGAGGGGSTRTPGANNCGPSGASPC